MISSGNDVLYLLGSIKALEVSPAISPDGHLEWGSMRCGGDGCRRGAGEFGVGELVSKYGCAIGASFVSMARAGAFARELSAAISDALGRKLAIRRPVTAGRRKQVLDMRAGIAEIVQGCAAEMPLCRGGQVRGLIAAGSHRFVWNTPSASCVIQCTWVSKVVKALSAACRKAKILLLANLLNHAIAFW